MEHPDLYVFPPGHPPSPYDRPVSVIKVGEGFLPGALRLCAVGWLEKAGFPTGPVPDACVEALVRARENGVFSDGHRGIHSCTLCGRERPLIRWRGRGVRLTGHGHYLIRLGETVYMAPELLPHYVRGHHYRPPEEFVRATTEGKFLTEDDLEIRWRRPGS